MYSTAPADRAMEESSKEKLTEEKEQKQGRRILICFSSVHNTFLEKKIDQDNLGNFVHSLTVEMRNS